ncbi:MAG: DnaD domain-containing protein [Anaerolineae bacterium]
MTTSSRLFAGFPNGRLRVTPVPDVFFAELLGPIDDLAELKVTLYIMWRLQRLVREPRHLSLSELRASEGLLAALSDDGEQARVALEQGLARAVTRGTLLRLADVETGEAWFFLNSEQGREGFARAQRGEAELVGGSGQLARLVVERPNIYQLYEQAIGILQPLIVDQLRDAESTYPSEWIEEAFRIAVEQNKRSWAYVRSILERWTREGKDGGLAQQGDRARYIKGKYGDRVQH